MTPLPSGRGCELCEDRGQQPGNLLITEFLTKAINLALRDSGIDCRLHIDRLGIESGVITLTAQFSHDLPKLLRAIHVITDGVESYVGTASVPSDSNRVGEVKRRLSRTSAGPDRSVRTTDRGDAWGISGGSDKGIHDYYEFSIPIESFKDVND